MACVNRNTKEYQKILDEVGDPFLADVEYIYQYRRIDVFRNDNKQSKLETVNGSLGTAIYLTDNNEYANQFGNIRTNYYLDIEDIISIANDMEFLKVVNKHFNLGNKIPNSQQKQEFLDKMFEQNKIIKVNRFNGKDPKTNYLIGNITQIYSKAEAQELSESNATIANLFSSEENQIAKNQAKISKLNLPPIDNSIELEDSDSPLNCQ